MVPSTASPDNDAPPVEVLDFPRRDLAEAVRVSVARHGRLLTTGELQVVARFQTLPDPAASLYARLFGRRPRVFHLEQLDYAEIPCITDAARDLFSAGLAWAAHSLAPAPELARALTVHQLKVICKDHGLPTSGRREQLVTRVLADAPRQALAIDSVLLRHRSLFRRLCRQYLGDHQGDLSRLVVQRLGHVHYVDYTPTGGPGLWPCRADLLSYEQGLERQARCHRDAEATLQALPSLLDSLEGTPLPAPVRLRFSGRRFDEALALDGARQLERSGQPQAAALAYRRMLGAGMRHPWKARHRLALCHDALGQPALGLATCREGLDDAPPAQASALDRTGRRLARKLGLDWPPRPALRPAPLRQLQLVRQGTLGHRPAWASRKGPATIELAVVDLLDHHGRVAVHGETGPWSTLFGLLFRDILFMPVPGMLPTPLLTAPLDLPTRRFYPARRQAIDDRLRAIEGGEAPGLLDATLDPPQAIAGVRWDLFSSAQLRQLVRSIDGAALSALLRPFATDWRHARSGMPDLCILPGPEVRIPGLEPAPLPAGLLLVEVKGPTDTLRDAQRLWLDRLLGAGLDAQRWAITETPPRP